MIFLALSPLSQAASMEIVQKGVSGAITSEIGLAELTGSGGSSIFFGTQLGAYVFTETGSLVNFIQTGGSVTNIKAVPDINGNGHKELVLTTSNPYFPNVLCFDSQSGEKLWEFSSETEVFDMSMMWTMKQVPASSLEVQGNRIFLTAGYNVYCLDSKSGERLWSYEGTDNMWDIALSGEDVIAGDQNGYVYRLDSGTGEALWSVLVSQPYRVINPSTKQFMGEVTRSVWDVVPLTIDSQKTLAASCEDGYVHFLDLETGELLDSVEIIDYSDELLYTYYGDYPVPTSFADYNYFNIRADYLPDVNYDGNPELLVYTYPGPRMGKEYQGATSGFYVIDSSSREIITKNENIGLSSLSRLGTLTVPALANQSFILLPLGKTGATEKVRIISPVDGSTEKTISINSTSGQARRNKYVSVDLGQSNFLLASDYSDIIKSDFRGKVLWSYPRLNSIKMEKANLVGTSEEDMLIYSVEGVLDEDFLTQGSTRSIFVVDGETREVSWSYEMPYEEFLLSGGLQGLMIIPDINSDGRHDIAAYKQWPYDWGSGDSFGNHTRIVVFSGTGQVLWENPITDRRHYGIYERIYKYPPYIENMLAMQWGFRESATVLSIPVEQRGEFRRQLMELEDRLMENEEDKRIRKVITSLDVVEDVSGDSIPDFIVGSWKDVYIIDSVTGRPVWNRTYEEHLYEDPFGNNPMRDIAWNWTESDRMKYISLGDVNSDGYSELLQVSWNTMRILKSNLTGSSLDYIPYIDISVEGDFDENRVRRIGDINNDGFPDIIFMMHIKDSPDIYKIVRGNDGSDIFELERDGTSVSFAAGDLNSDKRSDTIVFYSYGESGPRLEVISGRSKDVMWSFGEYEETWMLMDYFGIRDIMPACPAGDMNGDGSDDLVLGRSLPWDKGAELLVYDIKNNELIKSISIESTDPMRGFEEKRWQPAVITTTLADITGDGFDEVATVMALGEGNQKQMKLVIVDLVKEEIISDFTARGTKIVGIGELIAAYGTGGELYLLQPGREVTIISPEDGESVSSPLRVTWEGGGDAVKILIVDAMSVMKTSGNNAEFDIRAGERKVSIYSFDRHGKGVYDSVDVVVVKDSASAGPLTILAFILLLLLFIPKLLPRLTRIIPGLGSKGIKPQEAKPGLKPAKEGRQ